jgi:hypothetical protein
VLIDKTSSDIGWFNECPMGFILLPALSTALEVKPANTVAAADSRRANQEAPLGTALVANGRCVKNRNFVRVGQQLGTRHHIPVTQDDKTNSRIS